MLCLFFGNDVTEIGYWSCHDPRSYSRREQYINAFDKFGLIDFKIQIDFDTGECPVFWSVLHHLI
jgi:hypothetical protein